MYSFQNFHKVVRGSSRSLVLKQGCTSESHMKLKKKIHPRTTKLLSSTGRGGECAHVFLNIYRSDSNLYPCDRDRVYGSKAIQCGGRGSLGKRIQNQGVNPCQWGEGVLKLNSHRSQINLPPSLCIQDDLDHLFQTGYGITLLLFLLPIIKNNKIIFITNKK